jgi:hypothetical protein
MPLGPGESRTRMRRQALIMDLEPPFMDKPLTGVAALIQHRIDRLAQRDEWLLRHEGSEFEDLREQHEEERKELRSELCAELESRRIVLLAVVHALQDDGDTRNEEFKARLSFLADSYAATTILEEWAYDRPQSFASVFAKGQMDYQDVGTPPEPRFKTFANAPIIYPGHDGTLGPCPDAPQMMEYGPLSSQENREQQMLKNIESGMQRHRVGLFIVGLAHLHSMSMKLQAEHYRVAAYTWLG